MGKITILRAGPLTTVQDLGRSNQRKAGVSVGGALDPHAARVANLLVDNAETAALLEIGLGKIRIRFHDERVIAWCGGEFQLRIAELKLPPGRATFVRPDEELEIHPRPERGCRAWIAFSGGIDLPLVLGSRATDLRAGFGGLEGRALRDGDELPLGITSQRSQNSDRIASWGAPAEWACTATAIRHPTLRVVRGPEWSDFTPSAQTAFFQEPFGVSTKADRMGARLEGPELRRITETELLSAAVAPGTIQVPNDGQPIILLGDCQTIGGYPKIAHVITVDLPITAQLRPNDTVRFSEVSLAQARDLFVKRENDLERFRLGLRLRGS
jgi:antagonist of KipI